jgi:geranylgeranyl diphosphate synthase type I
MVRYHLGWEDQEGRPFNAGGKGLRPSLCLLACEAVGGQADAALPAAAAVELVHNFSLIHDDIQDRDPERHHRPAVWSVWGEAQAINAGDALLSLAHSALLRMSDTGASREAVMEVARVLSDRTLEMVEGQTLDLSFESEIAITLDDYFAMIEKKSGALFGCALRLGAISGGAEGSVARALESAGRALGTAFQIKDDVLGVWGETEKTGKPSEDIRRRKKSLPVVYALNEAPALIRHELTALYNREFLSDRGVASILDCLDRAAARDYCNDVAESYRTQAQMVLDNLPLAEHAKHELRETAAFFLEREY